jgi:hypothetical protein
LYNQRTKQYISKQHIMLINHDQQIGCTKWVVTERAAVLQLHSRLPLGPGRSERPSPPCTWAGCSARWMLMPRLPLRQGYRYTMTSIFLFPSIRTRSGHPKPKSTSGTAWASHQYSHRKKKNLRLVVDLKQSNMSKSDEYKAGDK